MFDFEAITANGGKRVANFGTGKVSVQIPYTLGTKEEASKVCAVYVDKNGKVTWLKDSIYNAETKMVEFQTNHFSSYGVGYKENTPTVDTSYKTLKLQAKGGDKKNSLTWKKVKNADGYIIYGAACGSKEMKQLKVIQQKDTLNYTQKNLKSDVYYKYQVKAYQLKEGEKEILSTSKLVHSAATGSKKGNPVKISIDQNILDFTKNETRKLNAKIVGEPKKEVREHTAPVRYESSDKTVAVVTANGTITAKEAGFCYIYVYAQNGMSKRVYVSVE